MLCRRSFLHSLGLRSLGLAAASAHGAAPKGEFLMFVGTYTNNPKSKGVYAYRFDASSGRITPAGVAAETANPSFLAIHPNGRYLYAVGELSNFQGQRSGAVTAFSIDRSTGVLTELNQLATRGTSPCHLKVDQTGRNLIVVNYGTGSTICFRLGADGKLQDVSSFIEHKGSSVDPKRQQGPHAHSINLSADNRFAVVADLGLDQVIVYRFDAGTGVLAANDPPYAKVKPGGGPRHFHFHPNRKNAYVINEMGSTVTAFAWDRRKGALTEIQTLSTLPADFKENNSTAEVLVHPSGKFLYGSNRGHNSIAVFRIVSGGRLAYVENTPTQGRIPRNFAIDPTSHYLLAENQQTDSIVVFRIDQKTGKLTPTGQTVETPSPVCIRFLV